MGLGNEGVNTMTSAHLPSRIRRRSVEVEHPHSPLIRQWHLLEWLSSEPEGITVDGGIFQRVRTREGEGMKSLITGLAAVVLVLSWAPAEVTAAVFFDDFNDGNADGWVFPYNSGQSQGPGDWTVENGELVQHFFGDNNAALVDNLIISDQVIEAQMRTQGYTGVALWYNQVDQDWANWIAVSHNYQTGMWVHEFIDGVGTRYSYGGPWIPSTTWFDLKVEADSATGSLTTYLDGAYLFTHFANTPYRTGLSGLRSGNHFGYFDNFRLPSAHIIPEPSTLIIWSLLGGLAVTLGCHRRLKTA